MHNFCRRITFSFVLAAALASAATLPTPEQFAGFQMGADKKLVRYDKIVEYMRLAAAASPRIRLEELGKSTMGNPLIMLTISSPDNLKNLQHYKDVQKRLAYPKDLSEAEASKLIAQQKAVVLITCNIHSTEIGSSQMSLEVVHRLATEDSPYIQNILNNLIFLFVPSFNPDGQILVTDWFNKNVGTEWEWSPMPELYHKYTGHDNNRDAYMETQVETRIVNKITYQDWFPVVYLDEHQKGNMGDRLFVAPFKDPINPNIEPAIWKTAAIMGANMSVELHNKGYNGVISNAAYTSWWQGCFLYQAWWHNMVGLLTEAASVNIAAPVDQLMAKLGVPTPEPRPDEVRNRSPREPLLPPVDTTPRFDYPRPWLGGHWTLRNIVEYENVATFSLLEICANMHESLTRNFYVMNRHQIELGKKDTPYAYVVSKQQHDPPVAAHLMQLIINQGAEVHQASQDFEAGGRKYPAGSYVVLMAQPFRPFVKDLFEKQDYPATKGPDGQVERPYDVTGWTLPYQMCVEAVQVDKAFQASLERVMKVSAPGGSFEASGTPAGYTISHATNNSSIAVNRLLKAGADVFWGDDGGIFVAAKGNAADQLREMSRSLGINVRGAASAPASALKLRAPRIGQYEPWNPSMDAGWNRWLMEQYEFPFQVVRDADIKAGKLNDRFDVIVLADIPKMSIIDGITNTWTRPEHRGGLGRDGVANLKAFVAGGGTLLTMGSSSLVPVEEFPLPLKNALKGLSQAQFFCPGAILRAYVDNRNPVAYGMPSESIAFFYNDVAFDMAAGLGDTSVKTIVKYPADRLLRSGWVGGEQYLTERIAAAEVTLGKGRVVLLGFSPQQRAQPHATFKLMFNALHYAATERTGGARTVAAAGR